MTIVSFSTGLGALNSINQIQRTEQARTGSIAKISTSLKIRKAADSVADSAIGTKIKVEVASLKQILIGTAQAQSALEIAEGALNEITNNVIRLNTLAKQSVNGTNSDDDRYKINLEYQEILKEVDRIADATNFNSKKMLSGEKTIIDDKLDSLRENFLGKGGLDERGKNIKGGGFDSIVLDREKDAFDYQITYNKDTQMMKVTNKETGEFEEVQLSRDPIKDIEKVSFTKMDLKVTLNSFFNKNESIGAEYAVNTDDNNYKLVNQITSNIEVAGATPKVMTLTDGVVTVNGNKIAFSGLDDLNKNLAGQGDTDASVTALFGTGTIATGALTFDGTDVTYDSASTQITLADAADYAVTAVNDFKITSVDSDGKATFESNVTITSAADAANTGNARVKGTIQLTIAAATDALDKESNIIQYNRGGMVTTDNKTYTLKEGEYVDNNGAVKDIFGKSVDGIKVVTKEAGIDANNSRVFISGGSGRAGDITDFALKMTGTNGAAKFVISAAEGDFVSEGTYDLTNETAENKEANGTIELKAGLNEITLSRQVRKTDKEDMPREKDTIKVTIILNEDLNTIDVAKVDTDVTAADGFMNGKGVAGEGANAVNENFAMLNELKNSRLFYQEQSDVAEFSFRVGTGDTSENIIDMSLKATTTKAMNIAGTDVLNVDNANEASKKLSAALDYIQEERAKVGVTDNRIGFANKNIETTITNSQAAVSAIFDLDVPSEIAELSQTEMKQTASIESLSRDMRSKQSLLKLF